MKPSLMKIGEKVANLRDEIKKNGNFKFELILRICF